MAEKEDLVKIELKDEKEPETDVHPPKVENQEKPESTIKKPESKINLQETQENKGCKRTNEDPMQGASVTDLDQPNKHRRHHDIQELRRLRTEHPINPNIVTEIVNLKKIQLGGYVIFSKIHFHLRSF